MKIVQTLNIPVTYFYAKVIDSVLYDIKQQTGQSLRPERLQGFEYKKDFSRGHKARVKITKNVINSSYHFETTTTGGIFKVSYDMLPTTDNKTQVTYEETSEFRSPIQAMNQKIAGFLVGVKRKKNFTRMLNAIERSYDPA
ncbi:DUF3284 domain-containing protein [Lacticaseibacillus brantae]|uniref:DUF3284 domain-containing protein n=1 Tax=Lacticaseibacillus brantae DSM 23927 TaxID=1423727 RepID=A0A0R2B9H6_9LACO|nr:DUF3284 domain-containing protein [Lacticaseibacillus brantae]KRM73065.1 hypothetical protein FC34_GL000786 [Lacticaseibacillus brantae DSM 23927]